MGMKSIKRGYFVLVVVVVVVACGNAGGTETVSTPACEGNCLNAKVAEKLLPQCPELDRRILENQYPRGGPLAGGYIQATEGDNSTESCAEICCKNTDCNYIMMDNNGGCFLLSCEFGGSMCAPKKMTEEQIAKNLRSELVMVRKPVVGCLIASNKSCATNEVCNSVNPRSEYGVCVCQDGFVLTTAGDCVPPGKDAGANVPTPLKQLQVTVENKNVTLPVNEVFLVATVTPAENARNPYSYEWKLISHPSEDTGEGSKEGQTTSKLHLMGLKEGSYVFQVSVKSTDGVGLANATVIVFQEDRINLPPVAVISPAEQVVQLPTASVVLDAGASTDDDKIISYSWELQKGPLQYTFSPLKKGNLTTLQIENLIPGNYTFKLTVEDSGQLTNSTTANITVNKETDYPPTAIAGTDAIVHLPEDSVTLNGNASTDDKKIVMWEWKPVGEGNKAVDMQDTHTPYLKLSHLQEGIYEYQLTVTDESGQSSTSTVHVFVKPPSGKPPQANAGSNQTISLPQTWALLDASGSKAETKVMKYVWSQLKGPTNATIAQKPEEASANVTGLTKGDYEFQVEVEDDQKLVGKSSVFVIVVQKTNEPPVAHAGGERHVTLPVTVVTLNGSQSTDDVKIFSWKWERMPESVAAGEVLGDSDTTAMLQLSELVPGKYIFKLIVKDEQGLYSEDTATLLINENPAAPNLLEVTLQSQLTSLMEADVQKYLQQMSLLLHDTRLVLDKIQPELNTGNAVLIIHGINDKNETVEGYALALELRQRLRQDVTLLQVPVVSLETVQCLDKCSGHGTCNDSSVAGRQCVCNTFWMQNFLKRRFGNGERNCEWSKIYVFVVSSLLLSMFVALIWSLVFLFHKNFASLKSISVNGKTTGMNGSTSGSRGKRQKRQYTLLDDDEIELESKDGDDDEDEDEYDDSDSDVLFETASNSSRTGKRNGSSKKFHLPTSNGIHRNGILKHSSRRVKT